MFDKLYGLSATVHHARWNWHISYMNEIRVDTRAARKGTGEDKRDQTRRCFMIIALPTLFVVLILMTGRAGW